jgi:hypothetical protein
VNDVSVAAANVMEFCSFAEEDVRSSTVNSVIAQEMRNQLAKELKRLQKIWKESIVQQSIVHFEFFYSGVHTAFDPSPFAVEEDVLDLLAKAQQVQSQYGDARDKFLSALGTQPLVNLCPFPCRKDPNSKAYTSEFNR